MALAHNFTRLLTILGLAGFIALLARLFAVFAGWLITAARLIDHAEGRRTATARQPSIAPI